MYYEDILNKHEKLRNILISYGCEEYGDCIIDEICDLFNYPNTIDVEYKKNKFKNKKEVEK